MTVLPIVRNRQQTKPKKNNNARKKLPRISLSKVIVTIVTKTAVEIRMMIAFRFDYHTEFMILIMVSRWICEIS
jgi:hypothetical protein